MGYLNGDTVGRLVVIEGVDDAGKTSLAHQLVEDLQARGTPAVYESSPGSRPGTIGALVYAIHHAPAGYDLSLVPTATSLQMMHAAAHIEAIERHIKPQLETGTWVVLDRWWWSMVVYGTASGVPSDILDHLVEIEQATWLPVAPHIVLLVERNVAIDAQPDLSIHYRAVADRARDSIRVERVANNGTIEDASRAILHYVGTLVPNDEHLDRSGLTTVDATPSILTTAPHRQAE